MHTAVYKQGEENECFREYGVIRGRLGIFSIHGGSIENGTEQIARYLAERTDCTVYIFSGRERAGNRRLHIPSNETSWFERPFFKECFSRVEAVVALHGHGRNDNEVYIGGKNVFLKKKTKEVLEKDLKRHRILTHEVPNELRGRHPDNFTNLPVNRGIQIELPRSLRKAKTTTGWSRHEWSELYGDTLRFANSLTKAIENYLCKPFQE